MSKSVIIFILITIKMMYVKALRFCSKICSSLYIGWNKIYFFLNNIKYGKNFRVFNHLYLKIHVGALDNLDWKIRCSEETNEYGESVDMVTAASAPIVIEDNVLVGARCIILKGVTIGARSIIGSGSIVTKDIPSDCIAAGNPCKVIKSIVY